MGYKGCADTHSIFPIVIIIVLNNAAIFKSPLCDYQLMCGNPQTCRKHIIRTKHHFIIVLLMHIGD